MISQAHFYLIFFLCRLGFLILFEFRFYAKVLLVNAYSIINFDCFFEIMAKKNPVPDGTGFVKIIMRYSSLAFYSVTRLYVALNLKKAKSSPTSNKTQA